MSCDVIMIKYEHFLDYNKIVCFRPIQFSHLRSFLFHSEVNLLLTSMVSNESLQCNDAHRLSEGIGIEWYHRCTL